MCQEKSKAIRAIFRMAPPLELKKPGVLFQHGVFRMLIARGKISQEMIALHSTRRHPDFHRYGSFNQDCAHGNEGNLI
jgi:hypothetical protein